MSHLGIQRELHNLETCFSLIRRPYQWVYNSKCNERAWLSSGNTKSTSNSAIK